jgi:hypothetical protein
MGFLDKAKSAAEQAAAKAKEGVGDVQNKIELNQTYTELGKTAFELTESGEISHPRLQALADKIRALRQQPANGDSPAAGASSSEEQAEPAQTST